MKPSWYVLVFSFFLIVCFRVLSLSPTGTTTASRVLIGGVVPHHLFVRDIISDFFAHFRREGIDNVIVIGPNHLEIGDETITFNPSFDDQTISALTPFLHNTFPHVHIVPVLLKRELTLADCQALARQISQIPGNNLVLASIDFSHYLTSSEAQVRDQETLSRLNERDYAGILQLGSDYLDSNAALVTAMMYFENKGLGKVQILHHTNSGLRGNPYAPTTSYFALIVYGKN